MTATSYRCPFPAYVRCHRVYRKPGRCTGCQAKLVPAQA